jgi:hypothetical protein
MPANSDPNLERNPNSEPEYAYANASGNSDAVGHAAMSKRDHRLQ